MKRSRRTRTVSKAVAVYTTPFDPKTQQATSLSTPTEYESIEHARVSIKGKPIRESSRTLIYPGICISDYPVYTGPLSTSKGNQQ